MTPKDRGKLKRIMAVVFMFNINFKSKNKISGSKLLEKNGDEGDSSRC